MHPIRRTLGTAVLAAGPAAACSPAAARPSWTRRRSKAATCRPKAPPAAGAAGCRQRGTAQSSVATVDLSKSGAGAAGGMLAQRIVYFDFDSFVVKDEYRPMLEAHAKVLSANRSKRMMLEGHTDERGGREYNLALGQKRAEAVLKSMVLLGVQDNQLEAVSFGEEKPAVPGSDEAAWAKNRRVELKDR